MGRGAMQWGGMECPSEDGSFIKLRAKKREENRVQGRCFGERGSLRMFLGEGSEVADIRGR